jgi:phosphoribosylanthranilate isomerase
MSRVAAKICGLNSPASVAAAVEARADYAGFVFFPRSPRAVTPQQAGELINGLGGGPKAVGLFVDPDDALIGDVLAHANLALIQLHGSENPERVAQIKAQFGVPVMKAFKIAEKADLDTANDYISVADMLLFDAKAPKNLENALPGGNGLVFDWRMLTELTFSLPWMLAGGLDDTNVTEAVTISGASIVDTSSGVEIEPGVKDTAKIARFVKTVHDIN